MRILLIACAFFCLQVNGQDKNKVALTAGSEFLIVESKPTSLTKDEIAICPFDAVSRPKDEFIAQLPQSVEVVSSQKTNPIIYLVLILLVGFAIHFLLTKKETAFVSQVSIEEEEDPEKKKELWDALAQPDTE